MLIKTITAVVKYTLINNVDLFQYLYKKLVATNFPISSELAIVIAAIEDPLNNIPIPRILKNPEQHAMNNEDNPTILSKEIIFFICYIYCQIKKPSSL